MSRKIGFLFCVTMVMACGLALAAPSLPVTKVPVTPNPSSTGPTNDEHAIMGQWFIDLATSNTTYRTHEFYDNTTAAGGGSMGHLAISGRVTVIQETTFPAPPGIVAFDVEATIWNDSPANSNWFSGTNILGETLSASQQYTNTLRQVVVSAGFATAGYQFIPGTIGSHPFRDVPYFITATNHDLLAWYGYYESGNYHYFVPAWNFGDISAEASAVKTFRFTIQDLYGGNTSLPPGDPRYDAITYSYNNGTDIFINRSLSLKISEWISDPAGDTGDGGATNSNVSVFHNTDEDANQGLSITGMDIQGGTLTIYSRGCTNGINPQILQACTNLISSNWVDVATNVAAWPLPQTNSWSHSNIVDTLKFYRIVQP